MICIRCKKRPALEDKTKCRECREYLTSWKAARKTEGLCQRCQNYSADKDYCSDCAEYYKRGRNVRLEFRKQTNVCVRCGQAEVFPFTICLKCRVKDRQIRMTKKRETSLPAKTPRQYRNLCANEELDGTLVEVYFAVKEKRIAFREFKDQVLRLFLRYEI